MTTTISVKHHFSAGHRIPGLPGPGAKCSNLHGHTFGVTVELLPNPDGGELLEFGRVKQIVRGFIDDSFDHGFIAWMNDPLLDVIRSTGTKLWVAQSLPTTEYIAETILAAVNDLIPEAHCVSVEVTEGPHNMATAYDA